MTGFRYFLYIYRSIVLAFTVLYFEIRITHIV